METTVRKLLLFSLPTEERRDRFVADVKRLLVEEPDSPKNAMRLLCLEVLG